LLVKLWSVHRKICYNNLKTRPIRTKVGPFLESGVVLNFDLIVRCACLTYDLQNNYDNYCWLSNCFILRYSCSTHSDVDINIIYYNIDTMFHGFGGLSYFYEVV